MQNRTKENKIISNTLRFLEYGKFSERKKYLKDFHHDGVSLNGFVLQRETWCWLIWKPTDIEKEPQYKGEPVVKVVPNTVSMGMIEAVLEFIPWTYI